MKDLIYLNEYKKSISLKIGNIPILIEGYFLSYRGVLLFAIASQNNEWEHVSVSLCKEKRCPTWEEMCVVKKAFFEDDEVAIQIYPKKEDYVNLDPFTLHWWRPVNQEIPLPPKESVIAETIN